MKERIQALVAAGGPADEAAFEAEVLALYRWQVANNPDYAAFAAGAAPRTWREVPAVPVGLFRDLALTCFPPKQARVVFRTSGTTAATSGLHRLRDTDVYDLGAALNAAVAVGPIPARGVSLVSPAPDSSLGHMCRLLAPGLKWYFFPDSGLDREAALRALQAADSPVFVPATAFAMADLLAPEDEPPAPVLPLPPGSVVMVTGGYKGRRRAVDEAELTRRVIAAFPGATVVGEYGMTELSSQLWARPLGAPFRPPPWMRVTAVDPSTGQPTDEGQLRFVDLANHQTVLAIETQDLGRVLPDGAVILRGRLASAPPRGCSLGVEEASVGPGAR